MGTNYYLFTKSKEDAIKYAPYSYKLTDEPEFGYNLHCVKCSMGWLPLFQSHEDGIQSVKEYKEAYDTGDFKIYDEYGEEFNWEQFDKEVLQHNGGKLGVMKPEKREPMSERAKVLLGGEDTNMPEYLPVSHFPGSKQSYRYKYPEDWISIYKDDEGYEFEKREFS